MVTKLVTHQSQLIKALKELKADKHHNLDIGTLRKIDELINLLENSQCIESKDKICWLHVMKLLAQIIEKLPHYAELLSRLFG